MTKFEELQKARKVSRLIKKALDIVSDHRYKITDNLVVYLHIKDEIVEVGHLIEKEDRFILRSHNGQFSLPKGDETDDRDASYYFYDVKGLIDNFANYFEDQ